MGKTPTECAQCLIDNARISTSQCCNPCPRGVDFENQIRR